MDAHNLLNHKSILKLARKMLLVMQTGTTFGGQQFI
jgi:hypothetical protein